MIYDDFTTDDTTKWPTRDRPGHQTIVEGNLRLQFGGASNYTRRTTPAALVDLSKGPVDLHVAKLPPSGIPGIEYGFQLSAPGNIVLQWLIANNTATTSVARWNFGTGQSQQNTTTPTSTRWWRIAQDNGAVTWSTSPDGVTWTVRHTQAGTVPLLTLQLYAGYWGGDTSTETPVRHYDVAAVHVGSWSDTPPAPAGPYLMMTAPGVETPVRLEVATTGPTPPDPNPPTDELPATYSLTGLPRRVFTTGGLDFWYKPLPTSAPLDPQSANKVNFLIQTGINSWGSPSMGYPSWAMNYATNSPSVLVIKPGEATLPLVLRDPPSGPFGANLVNMFSDAKVPADAVIQAGGTDGFVCIYEIATDTYWEGWQIKWNAPGYPGWSVYRGQRLQNASTKLGRAEPYPNGSNPPFYYGTNAAGLAQEPGVIKVQELQEGWISHALSMAIPVACVAARDIPTPNAGISQPAVRSDGQSTEPYAIHMGQRLRLPASLNLDALDLHPVCRTIAKAFQTYGCYIVDRAGDCSFAAENQSDLPAGIYAPLMQGAQIHNVCWDPPKPGGGKYQPFPWEHLQLLRFETSLDGLP